MARSKEETMQTKTQSPWLAAVILALAVTMTAAACGSNTSQASARDKVTTASCDWQAMCGNIGSGKTYTSRDNCMTQLRAQWDTAWPAAECDGKIDLAQLDICLSAIHATECGNGLDVLNTLANKCPKAKVCAGP
jgi:hypothetical protein